MLLTLDLDEADVRVLDALHGTSQWGETREEVAIRLIKQRSWQLCGDALGPPIGINENPRADNQITKPV
jgi:hypothetical protein